MPFLYDFKLNGTKLEGIETGFSHSRKWEEALDDAKFSIPFYESEEPLSQYGLMEITIVEVDNYTDLTEIATETLYMLVISDLVSPSSQYGIWRHDISIIEYTAKLDAYIMASLAKTRDIEIDLPAKFEVTSEGISLTSSIMSTSTGAFTAPFRLPSFIPKQTYFSNKVQTFEQVEQSYLILAPEVGANYIGEYIRVPTVFRVYNVTTETYSSWYDLSNADVNITFTTSGKYQIEYGFQATQSFTYQDTTFVAGYYPIFRFYIKTFDETQLTVYDAIMSVRQNVSKGGGVESEFYFDNTRIFDIDSAYTTFLQSIPLPQVYLEQATARQMLIFILSYINALPRLEYGEDLDTLTIEMFNLSTGTFTEEDTISKSGSQNINQIGTRSYSPLNQVLPNNMDEPTMFAPSQDGFMQVRADNLQVTDSTFAIKLPKPIYTPKELVLYVPRITVTGLDYSGNTHYYTMNDLEIPMSARLINIEEWKLKYVTDNFPTVTSHTLWNSELGLRNNMVDNIYWQLGATKIQVSDVYGTITNKTLFYNVVKLSIYEYLMLHMPEPVIVTDYMYYECQYDIDLDFIDDTEAYKDLRFRYSGLTLENLIVKQDKEDLTQIDFYSEMRQNQDESIINVVRGTRKNYGNLQRTGNKAFSFPKIHYSLSEQYEIGQKDTNDYTITQIDRQFFGEFFIADYYTTKYHNRESRQTIVDQTYRWRDNYAKSVLTRNESYSDYLMIYPPNVTLLEKQKTKIYNSQITTRLILGILLGETITDFNTRASVALIRTDGMFEVEAETNGNKYSLLVPVSAYPVAKGFSFKFGFDGNLVAGDGLVQRGNNWYNQAVRYTNEQGRFTRFGFTIFPTYELDSDDYETYPKITKSSFEDLYYNVYPYFHCGQLSDNSAGDDALIVDKDPLTNYQQSYGLNVLSFYTGLYVLGQAFFNDNFIVNNPSAQLKTYLYLYDDDTYYDTFDDLFIKDGYASYVQLNGTNIEYDATRNIVSFVGISLTGITSWAIGNADGDLYIACNDSYNGFKIYDEHFRLNVKEIGNKTIYYDNPFEGGEVPPENYVTTVEFSDILVATYNLIQFLNYITGVEFADELGIAYSFIQYFYTKYSTTIQMLDRLDITYGMIKYIYTQYTSMIEMADELATTYGLTKYIYTLYTTTLNMADELSISYSLAKYEFVWEASTETAYNSASNKSTISEDTTGYTLPSTSGYAEGHVVKIIVYNLSQTSLAGYTAATTKIDLLTPATPPNGEYVENYLETDGTYWANFIAGNFDSSYVIRVEAVSGGYTYWWADYTIEYYITVYNLIN